VSGTRRNDPPLPYNEVRNPPACGATGSGVPSPPSPPLPPGKSMIFPEMVVNKDLRWKRTGSCGVFSEVHWMRSRARSCGLSRHPGSMRQSGITEGLGAPVGCPGHASRSTWPNREIRVPMLWICLRRSLQDRRTRDAQSASSAPRDRRRAVRHRGSRVEDQADRSNCGSHRTRWCTGAPKGG